MRLSKVVARLVATRQAEATRGSAGADTVAKAARRLLLARDQAAQDRRVAGCLTAVRQVARDVCLQG